MRGKVGLLLGLILWFLPAAALDLSGSFATGFILTHTPVTPWSTLELRLSLSTLEIQSLSTLQGLHLAQQALTISGSLGDLRVQAGVVLRPASSLRLGSWAAQDLQVTASFVSFELILGRVHLKLTLQAGSAEP